MVPTRTILHPHLDVITIRYLQDIPKNICGINQAKKAIQMYPNNITDDDYDYISDEIERCEKLSVKGM